ncbi:RteC domain-containing protein [Mucilaginibacter sp. SMC90]|uniref:RteC domain-containing protein n=1 Tax=Mucilaginibacter sp. SMC90 TaxID=2929803 RepID=UPI001FB2DB6D|nr:RteC domain-containing protein [Mucilaginibacter sp. SMC90]UOE51342.1 RteC domain-containing protein [Mucilaginibacter sp. SMC90]
MKKFTTELLARMRLELQQISVGTDDNLQIAEQSYNTVGAHMQKLKEFILDYQFKSAEEEIEFFKEIKPMFQKELIYFDELLALESDKPLGSRKKLKNYYSECLVAVEHFFARNHHLYNYYRTGKVHSDESYFLRNGNDTGQQPVYAHDLDRNFSTPYSITFSKLQAYEQLREFLLRAIEFKESDRISEPRKKQTNITWTDSNAAFIELMLGIYTKGSINFGQIAFLKFLSAAEVFFNIRVGNPFPVINSFGIRKKGRTPYVDGVKQSLEDKFDEKDE